MSRGWSTVNMRHEMFAEAIDIINALFNGGHVDYVGSHLRVDSAELGTSPTAASKSAPRFQGSGRCSCSLP